LLSNNINILKIEHLIVQHLYLQKQVTLQGIGTLFLNPSVALPIEGQKDFVMPDNAFTFEYNLKAGEDEALINYIIQQTRKMKSLAIADLESYYIISKQFLNIGKPMVIEGVGTIQKSQTGEYQFISGHFITPKIEDIPRQLKEKTEDTVSFESESKQDNSRRNILVLFFAVVVALAALGIYYFVSNKKAPANEVTEQLLPPPIDTIKIDTLKKPTIDTSITSPPPVIIKKDSFSFKIVIKDYPTAAAVNKAFAKLTDYGHKVFILRIDSTNYKLVMPFSTVLSDTTRAKDSLRIFFGGKPYVLKQ
jgi:hypothetical protein